MKEKVLCILKMALATVKGCTNFVEIQVPTAKVTGFCVRSVSRNPVKSIATKLEAPSSLYIEKCV